MSSDSPTPTPPKGMQIPELLELLSNNKRARIRSPIAPLQSEARVSAPQISQLIAGHVVQILEHTEDWLRIKGRDNYEGWVHAGYLEPASGSEHTWRVSIDAHVREADGRVRQLPLGARIAPGAEILEGTAVSAELSLERFPTSASAVAVTAAELYRGASYLWGGVTPWGCDCSGLVQSVFALHRVQLPRDAWQQAQAGTALPFTTLPANQNAGVIAGDLLFFSDRDDRRVTHVGIVADDNRMVHSTLRKGGVVCEKLSGIHTTTERLRAMFVCARRVLG